uniref:CSON015484 protein n=1 Tax=Culicoides sonorensis TaxID=179676 RepID=A0A336MDA1_CULSO
MVIVSNLQPLEFTDCLLDSPEFRDNLKKHEQELEKSSHQIKQIIKEVKDLLFAAKNLSKAQRTLSKSLEEFNFECIGSTQTDDEQVIAGSLKTFSRLISAIEDERDRMLDNAHDTIIGPLEEFRKVHIGGVKENKKKYDKKTIKFCQAQERFLNMSTKKPGNAVVEADASLGMLEREYLQESLGYVLRIQDVQERIKFEFVEIILRFISRWLVFYHVGHEVSEDAKEYMRDLQYSVQKKPESEFTKQGYLFLMEKKAFTATWSKYYCTYKKQLKQFSMLQYNQISGKTQTAPENLTLAICTRRVSDFEKRFCFDLMFLEKPGITFTFQALSEEDRKNWLNAMDGKEPQYLTPGLSSKTDEYYLDEVGFDFVKTCIEILEDRGLEEEGLYRVGGVSTKIMKLLSIGLDTTKSENERRQFFFTGNNFDILETKTIASALKHYLRHLSDPLMTYRLHDSFITAAKQETRAHRISDIHILVHRLPKSHFQMLDIVINHLQKVAAKSIKNKMNVFNLGVVFGPTLLRSAEETLASILDIKFNNVIIEMLIDNYDVVFKNPPGNSLHYMLQNKIIANDKFSIPTSTSENKIQFNQPLMRVVAKTNYTDSVLSTSLQNIPNGNQCLNANSSFKNDIRPISTINMSHTREIEKDSNPYVTQSHIKLYSAQYINLPNNKDNCFETNNRFALDSISHVDLPGHTDYSKTEVVNSTSSSNESLASSRDNSQSKWRHENQTLYKIFPEDQVILPKKGQKQDKEDLFKKLSPKDCLRVRTLYACLAENDGELSFEPNQIITYVRRSNERGWLIGTLNGKSGLIPENYVENVYKSPLP